MLSLQKNIYILYVHLATYIVLRFVSVHNRFIVLISSENDQSNLLCHGAEQQYTKQENIGDYFDHLHATLFMNIFRFSFPGDNLTDVPKSVNE